MLMRDASCSAESVSHNLGGLFMSDEKQLEIDRLRADLHEAHRARARQTYYFLVELRKEMEESRVVEILRRAAARVGAEAAVKMAKAPGADNMRPAQLAQLYSQTSPDQGRVYPIRWQEREDGSCRVETLACPIKAEMESMGISQRDFEQLVAILDGGTVGLIEGLGLSVRTCMPRLGGSVCCVLEIRRAATHDSCRTESGQHHGAPAFDHDPML
jgi:hypothetical protein